jgi:hypothetical protein
MTIKERIKAAMRKSWPIKCEECGKDGEAIMPTCFEMILPDGWHMLTYDLRSHYICKECLERRREWVQQILKK